MEAGSTDVKWKSWEKAGEPGKTRVALVEKSGPMDVLLDELCPVRPDWRWLRRAVPWTSCWTSCAR